MTVKLGLKGAAGEGELSAGDFMQQVSEAGYNPQGLSPDGMTMTLLDDQGEYSMPIAEIAQHFGNEVTSIIPENPDVSGVDTGLRFAVENIPDDDSRRVYLQAKVDRMYGEQAPKVMGQGSDWYYFDPSASNYKSLTNAPGMDVSDVGQIGAIAPKIAAETAGFAVGGPAGAGAANLMANAALKSIAATEEGKIPEQIGYGASFGTAGGEILPGEIAGALQEEQPPASEELAASIRGNIDPDFVASGAGPEMLKEAGVSAAFGGLLSGAGKVMPRAKELVQSGPLSKGLEATGFGAEAVGGGARRIGQAVAESPLLKETATYMGPAGNPAFAGTMARLPRGASTMGVEGMGKLRGVAERISPEIGPPQSAMRGWAADKLRGAAGASEELMAPRGVDVAEQVLSGARNITPEGVIGANARDIYGNLGQITGEKLQAAAHKRALDSLLSGGNYRLADMGMKAGDYAAKALPRAGEIAGQGMENIARLGRGVEGLAMGATQAGARGLQYGGHAMNLAGRGMQSAARRTRPMEPYGYYGLGRYGVEQGRSQIPDMRSEEEIMFDRWRKRRERDNMGLDFAQNR